MARDPPRGRRFALLGLWALWTRAWLTDPWQPGWGVCLALCCAMFLFFVGRAQTPWLGVQHAAWWAVACRADIAAFAAMAAPTAWWAPLWVFLGVFRATRRANALCDGGALWRGAPLMLLLHPRHGQAAYAADVLGVAVVVALRHREPPPHVGTMHEYHRQHDLFVAVDALSCWVLGCAGAPLSTRAALLAGTLLVGGALHLAHPRQDIGEWELANRRAKPHMPVTFRGVNDA